MPLPDRICITWRDFTRHVSSESTYLPAGSSTQLVLDGAAAMANCSLATPGLVRQILVAGDPIADPGAEGAYSRVRHRMALRFLCADDSVLTVGVASPKEACFLGDGITVDNTQEDVAALIAWVCNNGVNAEGSVVEGYIDGRREEAESPEQQIIAAAAELDSGAMQADFHWDEGMDVRSGQ